MLDIVTKDLSAVFPAGADIVSGILKFRRRRCALKTLRNRTRSRSSRKICCRALPGADLVSGRLWSKRVTHARRGNFIGGVCAAKSSNIVQADAVDEIHYLCAVLAESDQPDFVVCAEITLVTFSSGGTRTRQWPRLASRALS